MAVTWERLAYRDDVILKDGIVDDGSIFIKEKAAAAADVASYGQLWVKNNTPNELWFTDDAGTDVQLGIAGASGNPLTVGTDDTTVGTFIAYGGGAGADGGVLKLYLGSDDDGAGIAEQFYAIQVVEDDLFIGGDADTNALKLSSGGDLFVTAGTISCSDLTDGYIPYHVSDAAGLADSVLFNKANSVGINCDPNANLEIEDNGTGASMLVKITQDDANVYGLIIGNDTYSATDTNGLLFKVADTGAPTISWTAGVLTLSGGDVTIGSNANVNYSIKFDSSQSDGTITYYSAASDGYFYFNTPGLKLLAFGSFNTTGDTYFYASRSAVNYGVVKWDAVQDNVGNTDLWINTGFGNDKGVSIGYDSTLYPARTVATLDVRRIVNSTSSYGILYLQNDCDANPTIPYPVLRTDRYIEGHWMASLSISIAQWEDTGIAARSDIRFGLVHGSGPYPDANILSLRSDGLVTIGDGAAGTDYILKFDGETSDGTITWMEDEAQFKFSNVLRAATSLYRRYYHVSLDSANPGASGATWIDPGANSTGGWRLDAASEVLHGSTDVHSDWDGATDLTVEIRFYVNVNNTGGGAGDTVDLKAVFYYKGVGDTVTKTQTVEVATVVGASAQYKAFEADFTINWDEVSNVVEAGDVIGMLLNLETDTSEVDDIVVTGISFSYPTTHLGIEAGDT